MITTTIKNFVFLACLLCCARVLPAQPETASLTPRVSFEQRWPDANPQWFQLVIQSDGSTTYRSLSNRPPGSTVVDPAPQPFEFTFALSPRSRQRVFALAPQLPRFQGTLDKIKVAFTGTKTFRFEDGGGKSSAISFNYSSSSDLTGLTVLMEGISETIEQSQILQFQMRFDKLSLNETLRRMEELVANNRLSERQLLEPELKRIVNDPAIMNIARKRALHILQTPPEK
jgi:hypothetical protein